jgi:hypothetical protein
MLQSQAGTRAGNVRQSPKIAARNNRNQKIHRFQEYISLGPSQVEVDYSFYPVQVQTFGLLTSQW